LSWQWRLVNSSTGCRRGRGHHTCKIVVAIRPKSGKFLGVLCCSWVVVETVGQITLISCKHVIVAYMQSETHIKSQESKSKSSREQEISRGRRTKTQTLSPNPSARPHNPPPPPHSRPNPSDPTQAPSPPASKPSPSNTVPTQDYSRPTDTTPATSSRQRPQSAFGHQTSPRPLAADCRIPSSCVGSGRRLDWLDGGYSSVWILTSRRWRILSGRCRGVILGFWEGVVGRGRGGGRGSRSGVGSRRRSSSFGLGLHFSVGVVVGGVSSFLFLVLSWLCQCCLRSLQWLPGPRH
jgi:hypothetical protein